MQPGKSGKLTPKSEACISMLLRPRPRNCYSYLSATTGSRLAAWPAGQMPKNRPTPTDTITPETAAHIGTAVGRVERPAATSIETHQPSNMPDHPADPGEHHGLGQELHDDVASRRAPIALRMPISRVRSVTDTSMMFITPMPPTSKPIELEDHHHQRHRAGDLAELSTICSAVESAEVVRLVEGHLPLDAQDHPHLVDRAFASMPGLAMDDQQFSFALGNSLCMVKYGSSAAVVVLAGEGRRRPIHHADHLHSMPVHVRSTCRSRPRPTDLPGLRRAPPRAYDAGSPYP